MENAAPKPPTSQPSSAQGVSGGQGSPVFDRQKRAKLGANHEHKRLAVLGQGSAPLNWFDLKVAASGADLRKSSIEILQINLGKMCNLTCAHCHVEAGPDRTEAVTAELIDQMAAAAKKLNVRVVDLTGGAPEMCPGFKDYVRKFRALGCEIIVRSNLTILVEPGYEDFIDFFVEQKIHVIASLPCYSEKNVDQQRGDGVFDDSIAALQKLNASGYADSASNLQLDLVYNPGGASLPGSQKVLEQAYKAELQKHFGVSFNTLYCITNLPIGRFYSDLKKQGKADAYDELLQNSFNPQTVSRLMCRDTLNVSWDGWVYDCDFNQMLEMPSIFDGRPLHISNIEGVFSLPNSAIATGNHCFGCTAGAGSSCGGELLGS